MSVSLLPSLRAKRFCMLFSLFLLTIPFGNFLIAQCWQKIEAGASHNMVITQGGILWGWGSNQHGELGNGTNISLNIPEPIAIGDTWKDISSGSIMTKGIKQDGTLWRWGYLIDGPLPYPYLLTLEVTPVQIGADYNWEAVCTDFYFALALKTNGTLWSWGQNDGGQLGDGTYTYRPMPVQIGNDSTWSKISMCVTHSHAIKSNGTLWGWGLNWLGEFGNSTTNPSNIPVQIGNDSNWKSVSDGYYHTAALKNDSTLWTSGWNAYGQLGDGTFTDKNTLTQIGSAYKWIAVSCGLNHTMAIRSDSTLWTWGQNNAGQLGSTNNSVSNIPLQVGSFHGWMQISGGYYHSLAVKEGDTLFSWGKNDWGQLGDGTFLYQYSPVAIDECTSGISQPVTARLFIQGYYNGNNKMTPVLRNEGIGSSAKDVDTIEVELRNPNPPFGLVESSKEIVKINGWTSANFATNTGTYYIVIKHRNGVQTWSASPVTIPAIYDFTTDANKAYGSNQVQVSVNKWAFYSGDINQDNSIDAFDYLLLAPDIVSGNGGYLSTDLNGDGTIDSFDYLILDPNLISGIGLSSP
jgi:alpha-tubulin suppressor-like RCC1 family protein